MTKASIAQQKLSEKLKLLHELGYSDPYQSAGTHHAKANQHSDTRDDLFILDLIALCLTTGQPGDVVAATFDKRENLILILAKTGEVLHADQIATDALFSSLKVADHWMGLVPFLVERGKASIDKRIMQMHQSLEDLFSDLNSAAERHLFGTMEDEFPHSYSYRHIVYSNVLPPVDRLLTELICLCKDESVFQIQNEDMSHAKFLRLIIAAETLLDSRFFRAITGDMTNSVLKERVERLKCRLRDVTRYTGIRQLMKLVQRIPDIEYRWVNDNFIGGEEGGFETCADPMDIVFRTIREEPSLVVQAIIERFPDLKKNWEQQRHVNPCIHPEIRIILNLTQSLLSRSTVEHLWAGRPLPIGCSKRTCLCCDLWMQSVRMNTKISWTTSGAHGKPCSNWALPGTASRMMGIETWDRMDEFVITGIDERLSEVLSELHPGRT